MNLLENAIKFTGLGDSIKISAELADGQINIRVWDTGIGIPPKDLPHVFERFHRGRNVSGYPGNGLGLAIVKAIVGVHQGNVTVQSRPMHGTTVSVFLPAGD